MTLGSKHPYGIEKSAIPLNPPILIRGSFKRSREREREGEGGREKEGGRGKPPISKAKND